MEVMQSRVDVNSEEYKKNFDAMSALVDDLKAELKKAREDRSDKAKARNAELGKVPVQKRIELLVDKNSPWLELSPLAAKGMYDGRVHSAGCRIGVGMIHGKQVLVNASDPMIKGGTVYPMGVKKSLRAQTISMENRLPCINLIDSGGAFLPLQSEIFPDYDDGGRIFYNQAWMSKLDIPQITAVLGLCTAGGAYIPAMSDHVVHVKKTGAIFLGGPPLVKAATGEEVTAEQLGGAMLHCAESGVSDYIAEDDVHAMQMLRGIVKSLPDQKKANLPRQAPKEPIYDPKEIYGIVPEKISTPYDVREVIARMVDGSEFLEFKNLYGTTLVCGWAHIHGYKVGILGNNGVLFSDSSLKATQFIQLCDRQGIPLIFLQNISGYMIGRQYERGGITKDGHKMVNAVSTATVPKFTVIIGGSFGAGNYGMCGRAYSPRFLWMWPNGQIGVMGGEQAADVLITVKNDQLAREGQGPMPPEMADAIKEEIVKNSLKEGDAYYSTANIWDDGVIDPAKTRDFLGLGLSIADNAPLDDRNQGYGTFRM